ncbi:MAG: SDR family NAD(P)-dependent oxidoreductase [bacterium]
MNRLENKVVLVTGATSGIGITIAQCCAAQGAYVAVAGRNAERGTAVVEGIGERSLFVQLDVTDPSSWQQAIATVVEWQGRLDVLVNNAGVMSSTNIESTDLDAYRWMMDANVASVQLGCQLAIAQMKSQDTPASLVNVLSTTSIRTSAWTLNYGASKAAALSMTKSIAAYLAEQRYAIRCNAVLPGIVRTPLLDALLPPGLTDEEKQAALAKMAEERPLGRFIEPEEVAYAVVYLASEESSGVTGAHFSVDGAATSY